MNSKELNIIRKYSEKMFYSLYKKQEEIKNSSYMWVERGNRLLHLHQDGLYELIDGRYCKTSL